MGMPCGLAREPLLQAPRLRLPLCLQGLPGAGFPSRSHLSFPVCSPAERPLLPDPVSQHPTACPSVAVGSAGSSWSFTRHSALRLSPSSRRVHWSVEVPGQEQEEQLVWKDRSLVRPCSLESGSSERRRAEARGGLGRAWLRLPAARSPGRRVRAARGRGPLGTALSHLGCSVHFRQWHCGHLSPY